eukprot:SAG11_NODE_30590_length_299_cov_1.485000_1_plen_59_part_10
MGGRGGRSLCHPAACRRAAFELTRGQHCAKSLLGGAAPKKKGKSKGKAKGKAKPRPKTV